MIGSMKYEIKTRIKELRKEKGLTQKQLAALINKSETGLASWEQGLSEPSVNDLRLLCQIFEVSADYLLGLID
ncbi:MAG: helix-turn-helix domain-containing protein [Roseburia sp.]|nr:helix-turn-helix domain-containing protein [Roseburia sp.]